MIRFVLRSSVRCAALLASLLAPAAWANEAVTTRTLGGPAVEVRVERILEGSRRGGGLLARLAGTESDTLFVRPYGVAWQGDDLLVADPGSGRVFLVEPRGKIVASAEGLFVGPLAVAACPDGPVVADSRAGVVVRLDRKLRRTTGLQAGLERPSGVACQGDRTFVVETGAHRLLELDPRGRIVGSFGARGSGPGEFNFPAAVALDKGALWVGDTLNFRLTRIRAADWSIEAAFGRLGDAAGENPRIKGIAVDRSGNLWVSDAFLDNVALFDPLGNLLLEIGRRGTGPGEFSFPAGIAVHPDGRVAIADSLNRRIQILRLSDVEDGGSP